jgi:hypothetical protein
MGYPGKGGNGADIRLFSNAECDALGGNWIPNGECYRKDGGSWSWECRNAALPANVKPKALAVTTPAPGAWVAAATSGSWNGIDGNLKQVSVGDDGWIWGVTSGEAIFRRNYIQGSGWENIPGGLVGVDCANGANIVGVNSGGNMYQFVNGNWQGLPGSAVNISIGSDGTIWCVTGSDDIFRLVNGNWQNVPGKLRKISVGDANNIWGVDGNALVFRWNGSDWERKPGSLTSISVSTGGAKIAGGDANGNIFIWNGTDWQQASGSLANVDVSDTMLIGANSGGSIFYINLPPTTSRGGARKGRKGRKTRKARNARKSRV